MFNKSSQKVAIEYSLGVELRALVDVPFLVTAPSLIGGIASKDLQ